MSYTFLSSGIVIVKGWWCLPPVFDGVDHRRCFQLTALKALGAKRPDRTGPDFQTLKEAVIPGRIKKKRCISIHHEEPKAFPEAKQILESDDIFPGHYKAFCRSELEKSGISM